MTGWGSNVKRALAWWLHGDCRREQEVANLKTLPWKIVRSLVYVEIYTYKGVTQ